MSIECIAHIHEGLGKGGSCDWKGSHGERGLRRPLRQDPGRLRTSNKIHLVQGSLVS